MVDTHPLENILICFPNELLHWAHADCQLSTIRGVRVQGALIGTDDEVGGPGDEG